MHLAPTAANEAKFDSIHVLRQQCVQSELPSKGSAARMDQQDGVRQGPAEQLKVKIQQAQWKGSHLPCHPADPSCPAAACRVPSGRCCTCRYPHEAQMKGSEPRSLLVMTARSRGACAHKQRWHRYAQPPPLLCQLSSAGSKAWPRLCPLHAQLPISISPGGAASHDAALLSHAGVVAVAGLLALRVPGAADHAALQNQKPTEISFPPRSNSKPSTCDTGAPLWLRRPDPQRMLSRCSATSMSCKHSLSNPVSKLVPHRFALICCRTG